MTTAHTGPGVRWPGVEFALANALSQRWWLVMLRGLAAIAFGVLCFSWPGLSLLTLTYLWGAYAFMDGALSLGLAIIGRHLSFGQRLWMGLIGLVGLLAGFVAFAQPATAALALLLYIGVWAIIVGALQIWGGIRLRREIEGEWLLILSGLLTAAFGFVIIARPNVGALTVVWIIGFFAIMAGFTHLALAFRLRRLRRLA